jgi:hypothetical protein
LQTISVKQLRKVDKVFIDSTTKATSWLGISSDPAPDPRCTPREGKQWGLKSSHKLID